MNFACELMDLCRGTQELEAVLGVENEVSCDPLARLRLAIQYGEKKVNYTRVNCNSEINRKHHRTRTTGNTMQLEWSV